MFDVGGMVYGLWIMMNVRFGEDVVFSLDVMQPSTDAEEGLLGCKVVTGLGGVYETNGMQKLDSITFLFQFSVYSSL